MPLHFSSNCGQLLNALWFPLTKYTTKGNSISPSLFRQPHLHPCLNRLSGHHGKPTQFEKLHPRLQFYNTDHCHRESFNYIDNISGGNTLASACATVCDSVERTNHAQAHNIFRYWPAPFFCPLLPLFSSALAAQATLMTLSPLIASQYLVLFAKYWLIDNRIVLTPAYRNIPFLDNPFIHYSVHCNTFFILLTTSNAFPNLIA